MTDDHYYSKFRCYPYSTRQTLLFTETEPDIISTEVPVLHIIPMDIHIKLYPCHRIIVSHHPFNHMDYATNYITHTTPPIAPNNEPKSGVIAPTEPIKMSVQLVQQFAIPIAN